MIGSSSQLRR